MASLLYSTLDLAIIIGNMNLNCKRESCVINDIWLGEKSFLEPKYRNNKSRFILDIYYWMHYLNDKDIFDDELATIQRQLKQEKHNKFLNEYTNDYSDLDLYFKSIRINILYGNGNKYARIKLNSLISMYGYKRRSSSLVEYIKNCMNFYKLDARLRGGAVCDLKNCSLNDMITLRVIQNNDLNNKSIE